MIRSRYEITEAVKKEIRSYLREEKKAIVKERLTVVSLYVNGMIQAEIAKSIGRDRSFVGKAIRGYFKEGIEALQERRGGDRKSELSQEEKEEIGYIIENSYPIEHKGWDGKIIAELVEEKYGIAYNRQRVYNLLKKLNITYKKANKVDPKKSEKAIKVWKEDIKKSLVN